MIIRLTSQVRPGRPKCGEKRDKKLTIEAARAWVVVLDDALIDVDALGTGTRVDFYRVIGAVYAV